MRKAVSVQCSQAKKPVEIVFDTSQVSEMPKTEYAGTVKLSSDNEQPELPHSGAEVNRQ